MSDVALGAREGVDVLVIVATFLAVYLLITPNRLGELRHHFKF